MKTGNKHIAVKVTAVIIAVLAIINVIILMNPNRRARLIEFFGVIASMRIYSALV